MKRKALVLIVALMFMAAFVSCGGGSGGKNVKGGGKGGCELCGEATGYGQIFDNDTALARDRAIDDAMNKLVSSKLGTFVQGSSIVEDFALVSSLVETKSSGMVKNWKVLKEGAESGAFVATIYGEVYPQAVNDTIESTLKNYGRPKFMVLMNETFEGVANQPGFTVTELTMMELMGNAGFEFVDPAMTKQLMYRDNARMQMAMAGQVKGDVQSLLLDDAGAEVIIVGEAKTKDQTAALAGMSANMKSKSAIINIKAIDVYTGNIIGTTSANAPGVHIEGETASKTAIQNCLKKVLGKMNDQTGKFESGPFMNQITKTFLKAATGRMISMNIVGLDFAQQTKFRNEVQSRVRGVKKVYPRGQEGYATKIDVEFAGKTHDLAEELMAKAPKMGFQIEIKAQYPNKITMTATKNP
ncbi:MAG: hypothetical protein EPN93_08645 [Spirochaetes bacterium]|nr:MAG: hypothetical protein EPN93_08645 [Spirochaetota bacterium]